MKNTYSVVVKKPCLEIWQDLDSESPRNYQDNLGYFFAKQGKYKSPDGNVNAIYHVMVETGAIAIDVQDHIEMMTKRIEDETSEKVIVIYPVYRYEHGNVIYRRGTASGFNVSNCGFYIVTDKTKKAYGEHAKSIEALIDGELEEYTSWANGEVYGFLLKDKNGKELDRCGGFYSLEDIKAGLPKEWQKEKLEDYLI